MYLTRSEPHPENRERWRTLPGVAHSKLLWDYNLRPIAKVPHHSFVAPK